MDDDSKPTMRDVDHTPPDGEDVTNVWERGTDRGERGETEE